MMLDASLWAQVIMRSVGLNPIYLADVAVAQAAGKCMQPGPPYPLSGGCQVHWGKARQQGSPECQEEAPDLGGHGFTSLAGNATQGAVAVASRSHLRLCMHHLDLADARRTRLPGCFANALQFVPGATQAAAKGVLPASNLAMQGLILPPICQWLLFQ